MRFAQQRVVSGNSVRELINQFEDLDTSLPPTSSSIEGNVDDMSDSHLDSSKILSLPAAERISKISLVVAESEYFDFGEGSGGMGYPFWPCKLTSREIDEVMSSPIPNLDALNPRIAMTPSMLYAHAAARGGAEKDADPVYQALYPGASRDIFQYPVKLPHIEGTKSMEAFHKGAAFFWDPLVSVPEKPLHRELKHGTPTGQTFDQFMTIFKPTVGRNHSKGSQVYNNFGYIDANGKWVDPDSVGSMNDSLLLQENRGRSHQFSNDLPMLPATHKGPKIMSDEELAAFYDGYISEVSDDIDGEGDPRNHRITAAEFAKLVAGAVRGDVFEEKDLTPAIYALRPAHSLEVKSRARTCRGNEPEWDLEDGGRMSDVVTDDSNPSLQSSPRGVNLPLLHKQYSYLNPVHAHNLPIQNYTSHTGCLASLMHPSTTSLSTSASSPGRPFLVTEDMVASVLGEEGFEAVSKEVDEKREVYRFVENERAELENAKGEMERERDLLRRDVFFLRRDLEGMGPKAGAGIGAGAYAKAAGVGAGMNAGNKDNHKPNTKTSNEDNYKAEQTQAAPIDPITLLQREQRRSLRRRNQVARYINEEKQALDVGIWHAARMGEGFRDDVNSLREEIAMLKVEKVIAEDVLWNAGYEYDG